MTYISFILKPNYLRLNCRLCKCANRWTNLLFWFFKDLKQVGSVLSRSGLDPLLYYGIIQFGPKTGLALLNKAHFPFTWTYLLIRFNLSCLIWKVWLKLVLKISLCCLFNNYYNMFITAWYLLLVLPFTSCIRKTMVIWRFIIIRYHQPHIPRKKTHKVTFYVYLHRMFYYTCIMIVLCILVKILTFDHKSKILFLWNVILIEIICYYSHISLITIWIF